jgi:hypothetical protein
MIVNPTDRPSVLISVRTPKFTVLHQSSSSSTSFHSTATATATAFQSASSIDLYNVLWHERRGITHQVQAQLHRAFATHGYCYLTSHKVEGPIYRLLFELQDSLHNDVFPHDDDNATHLTTSSHIYISEKHLPMYHVGYERSEDDMRESWRIPASQPDHVDYRNARVRNVWLRGLGFCRHVTDVALDLLLLPFSDSNEQSTLHRQSRPGQGIAWWKPSVPSAPVTERPGDFSILYAMHYFNQCALTTECDTTVATPTTTTGNDATTITENGNTMGTDKHATLPPTHNNAIPPGRPASNHNNKVEVVLKAHVDPSLLVVEPFVCTYTQGLQVWDGMLQQWIHVDGVLKERPPVCLLLLAGQALVQAMTTAHGNSAYKATRHRVVRGDRPRSIVLYEQKYAEYFPVPDY